MLPSIDFDNKAMFKADEIDDIWPDRVLAAESESGGPARAQVVPESKFGFG